MQPKDAKFWWWLCKEAPKPLLDQLTAQQEANISKEGEEASSKRNFAQLYRSADRSPRRAVLLGACAAALEVRDVRRATVSQAMIDELCDTPGKHQLLHTGGGFATIYGPDGRELVTKLAPDEEGILCAYIDLASIAVAKNAADPAGHYSRPDVTRLLFNKTPSRPVQYFSLSTEAPSETIVRSCP